MAVAYTEALDTAVGPTGLAVPIIAIKVDGAFAIPVAVKGSEATSEKVIRKTLVANTDTLFDSFTTEPVTGTILPGTYQPWDGVYNAEYTDYHSLKVPCVPGDTLFCTLVVNGGATAMAVFYDAANTFMSIVGEGINGVDTPYNDYELLIPANAAFVAFTGRGDTPIVIKKKIVSDVATVYRGFDILNLGATDIYYRLDAVASIDGAESVLIPVGMGRTVNTRGSVPHVISAGTSKVQIVGWV